MDQEQSFKLAISLKNLRENKTFIVIILGISMLTGLYVGYPHAGSDDYTKFIGDFDFIKELFKPPLNATNEGGDDGVKPLLGMSVKWGFEMISLSTCTEKKSCDLGHGIFLNVCNYSGGIFVDIRKFTGNVKIGITPTIVGIGLNLNQWQRLQQHTSIINQYINDLS